MTEQQRYHVVQSKGSVELRLYESCTVADVVVHGSQERAGNAAFRPLIGYISGNNESGRKLAMTAPVVQERVSERLAMTAPVIQQATDDDSWTVSFVLPGGRPLDEYPKPTDPRVSLRQVPEHTAAALQWSGRWTEANVARRTHELEQAIAAAGWTPRGVARWARFDPPWKPAFARRNEIVMPVTAHDQP